MTDTNFSLSSFHGELSEASAALQQFAQGPGRDAANELGASFERAGDRIARALARAATSGEASFKRMAKVILEELARVALANLLPQSGKTPFFGARAAGGSVVPGGAYLVGERGPELFAPSRAGFVGPVGGGGEVNVHFHISGGGDMNTVARHQGQIAAALARAVAYGRRNL